MSLVVIFKAFGTQILNNPIGRNFKVLESSFEECTFKEYPTFGPPSSSIKCLIKNSTKLK
jgi:hypothetical protein